ncbi:Phenylalanine--tRNA ligase beta subunit [uncultured archaeon]|nr:Phenylalanine--tRNA ligase beta subunit [uncultured archaeon]
MAQVNFAFPDLTELINVKKEEAIATLTMLGFPAEEMENGELTVEVTPNRPDALCVEGLARVLRCYLTGKPASFAVAKPRIEAHADASVALVRPAFGCAVVRGVTMSDSFLRSLMQVQEKLHETLGRKRRKVAIGIHDLDRVEPPFRYFACGRDDVRFVPLEAEREMTPDEILREHPKGREFAHLVGSSCPMIEDRNHSVLSFPPIINGELTKLTSGTANLFIDTTGTSEAAVKQAVNIIVAMLSDRGGSIEEVKINGQAYALLAETEWPLLSTESDTLLGVKLTREEIAKLLSRMGHRVSSEYIHVPGYRTDIINKVDLIEDVAIAYGFNNFEPKLPDFPSVGACAPESACHELLVGMGFDEVVTWNLSNEEMCRKASLRQGAAAEIENPLTRDFTIFRRSLLPNLLSVLSESKNEKLPIRIYEEGPVAAPSLEGMLCIASMHPRASFSEMKGVVLALASAAGRNAEIKAKNCPPFIRGRCAELILDGKGAGHFGEVSPEALSSFSLEQPVCAAELKAF